MTTLTLFYKLARMLTVEDICFAIDVGMNPDTRLDDAIIDWAQADDWKSPYILVVRDENIVGWLALHEYLNDEANNEITISQVCDPVNELSFVGYDTPMLNAIRLFNDRKNKGFIVLKDNTPIGIIDFESFNKPQFRICLLSLILELEQHALEALQKTPNGSVRRMSTGRLKKATNVYKSKHPSYDEGTLIPHSQILECTMIIDRFKILPDKVYGGRRASRDDKYINQIDSLRNQLAHPSVINQNVNSLSRAGLYDFICWASDLERNLLLYLDENILELSDEELKQLKEAQALSPNEDIDF